MIYTVSIFLRCNILSNFYFKILNFTIYSTLYTILNTLYYSDYNTYHTMYYFNISFCSFNLSAVVQVNCCGVISLFFSMLENTRFYLLFNVIYYTYTVHCYILYYAMHEEGWTTLCIILYSKLLSICFTMLAYRFVHCTLIRYAFVKNNHSYWKFLAEHSLSTLSSYSTYNKRFLSLYWL